MGIVTNAAAIIVGGLLGSLFKTKIVFKKNEIFGIGVLILSAVGFFENLLFVSDGAIKARGTLVVVGALILGYVIGDAIKLEGRICGIRIGDEDKINAFFDATVFFGVGGLQICGPILLVMQNDSTQLYIKSLVDFPFALMFGAIYGYAVMASAVPVSLLQVAIAAVTYLVGDLISASLVYEICAVGYVILFFTGLNMICKEKWKISTVNMLPSIAFVILFDTVSGMV